MRRSICFCEPSIVLAGEVGTYKFVYQTANKLPKGAKLKFDLASTGRELDWEVPSVNMKSSRNILFLQLEDGTTITGKEVEAPESIIPQFEFVLSKAMEEGESAMFVMGAPPPKKGQEPDPATGTRAQTLVQRRRPFKLYVDPKGKGNYEAPETFSLDIKGNKLSQIRIVAPSMVVRNKRFDVTIRFEDQYGNLTSNAPEGTLIDLSYENLRESLNWKLFVPETGFVVLPNIYLNEIGVYKIRLENLHTGDLFFSSPIKCFQEADFGCYWGLLHGESERVDSAENIESCLRYFRDDQSHNFFATSNFESAEETSNEVWKAVGQNVISFNEDDRFVSLLGFQWVGEPKAEGVRQFVYAKDGKPLLRYKDIKYNILSKIYTGANPKEMLTIPSFTMGKGVGFDFNDFDPTFERVVEIYNAWGCCERTEKEGNPRPIKSSGRKGIKEDPMGSIQKALAANKRFGFVAGGLDDRGIYDGLFCAEQVQYSPGLTAILATKYTRDAVYDALYRRACYATTGERIVLGLTVTGSPMGSELSTKDKPGLTVNRHIAGYVAGTGPLHKVELIRNGEVLSEIPFQADHIDFTYDDLDPLDKVVFPAKDDAPPFCYYYLRVTQKDEHMAWSSPIWVDMEPKGVAAGDSAKKVKKAKS